MKVDSLLKAIENMRYRRRLYLRSKAECQSYKVRGYRPDQYACELKQLNDHKSMFFGAVQQVLDATVEVKGDVVE
jgi:hypothetical protein